MHRKVAVIIFVLSTTLALGCAKTPPPEPLPNGLMLALAVLESGPDGPVVFRACSAGCHGLLATRVRAEERTG